ncbi:MAG TPA: FAD-dependent oxidoreductase [Syntrophorhabdaceae bacterium]|nr:FAD-dependent oxidoreductase [Syntrophorhabdaceae bacterium]HQH43356.1 FAD-dependent oxidoreductase [Syntrophorhabdaceae bacterium]HRR71004.1 FAD-dependent oxidoreductase [Syntrophorhabdaceae bacterium]
MKILIIGGGISGISAAKVALGKRHDVTVLESQGEPGGLMARIANCRVGFKTFFDEIREKKGLTVINGACIEKVKRVGMGFSVGLDNGQVLDADRVIISAGLTPYDPVEYKGKRVLTSLEYDSVIDQRQGELPSDFHKIAFFLCVGSRSKEYPLCSSVCCSYTIREIKWTLQRAKPEITVFYNDLRFFGQEFFMERAFRDSGVRFIRANSRYFDEDDDGVTVRFYAGGGIKEERFNYAVLAIGLRPNPELKKLASLFGFSLNEYGFVREDRPLTTDAEGVYVSGGALEPMNIKDSILTGFGAGFLASMDGDTRDDLISYNNIIYREEPPAFDISDSGHNIYLFYLATENPGHAYLYEYVSARYIEAARMLKREKKDVYVVTRNMVTPSYAEIDYEQARREGVVFIHLEEEEQAFFDNSVFKITGCGRDITIENPRIIRLDDYIDGLKEKEFLSLYRSEPQLRWSPTKWNRKRYHIGFIRHPRDKRWEDRERLGAIGEITLNMIEERVLPQVNEERCSGCGSCKNACPHEAIEIELKQKDLAIFGPNPTTFIPIAHIREDTCAGCGLCVSTCPSDSISMEAQEFLGLENS